MIIDHIVFFNSIEYLLFVLTIKTLSSIISNLLFVNLLLKIYYIAFLDINESEKDGAAVEGVSLEPYHKLKDDDSIPILDALSSKNNNPHVESSTNLIVFESEDDDLDERNVCERKDSYNSIHDSEYSKQSSLVSGKKVEIKDEDQKGSLESIKSEAPLTQKFDPVENTKLQTDYRSSKQDVDDLEDDQQPLRKQNEPAASVKAINDSLVLAKELILIKEHNSWETTITNSGNVEQTVILKGSLDKYRPSFWPFCKGVLRYQFDDSLTDQGGVLRIEEKRRKWNSLSRQMTICKHADANWKEIGNLGKTRRGYNVFDGQSHKLFKIRKKWKFLDFKKKKIYSVRKIVLKDDILGSGCGTIEVEGNSYPEPISFKLKYSPSPGDFEEISLLVAVMFRMLVDSIVTF